MNVTGGAQFIPRDVEWPPISPTSYRLMPLPVLRNRALTSEGLETTFAVSALAPYRVTRVLAPLLRPPRRVVNVASIAHFSTRSID